MEVSDLPVVPGYEIVSELGHGGMGIVFEARQPSHDRTVALKFIRGGHDIDTLEWARFRIEADAVACLAHPNIIRIHEVGICSGAPYLALEYVPNGSLRERIQAGVPSPRWAAELIRSVSEALHHAHEKGILHRDLKPDNILLAEGDIPKISDFGLAKFVIEEAYDEFVDANATVLVDPLRVPLLHKEPTTSEERPALRQERVRQALRETKPVMPISIGFEELDSFVSRAQSSSKDEGLTNEIMKRLTRYGEVMGSPYYMAPEQAEADHDAIGPQTDVFALGVILYELLAGRPPFEGDNAWEIVARVRECKPKPIGQPISRDLKAVCMRCLKRRPGDRYLSADALAEDLDCFLNGYAISPKAPSELMLGGSEKPDSLQSRSDERAGPNKGTPKRIMRQRDDSRNVGRWRERARQGRLKRAVVGATSLCAILSILVVTAAMSSHYPGPPAHVYVALYGGTALFGAVLGALSDSL